jgi:AcrR family transcriptional regulator
VPVPASPRSKNQRGEGRRLQDEIVRGARVLLERTGDPAAMTLRGVAREIGIAAPSIYAHFADREAVVTAVRLSGFDELMTTVTRYRGEETDPVERLFAGNRGYLAFAHSCPATYHLMFDPPPGPAAVPSVGLPAFHMLIEGIEACVSAGRSRSTNATFDAVAVWTALHGFATLPVGRSSFPWPDAEALHRELVVRLARITPA